MFRAVILRRLFYGALGGNGLLHGVCQGQFDGRIAEVVYYQYLLVALRHVPGGQRGIGIVRLVVHRMFGHRARGQGGVGVAQADEVEISGQQGGIVVLLRADGGHLGFHLRVYLVRVGRRIVVAPQHRAAHVFVAVALRAEQAQLFSIIYIRCALRGEQHGGGQAAFVGIASQQGGGAVFVVVGQLGGGDVVGAHGGVFLAIAQQVVGQVASGAVIDGPLQAVPEGELEQGGQAGVVAQDFAHHVDVVRMALGVVGRVHVVVERGEEARVLVRRGVVVDVLHGIQAESIHAAFHPSAGGGGGQDRS